METRDLEVFMLQDCMFKLFCLTGPNISELLALNTYNYSISSSFCEAFETKYLSDVSDSNLHGFFGLRFQYGFCLDRVFDSNYDLDEAKI